MPSFQDRLLADVSSICQQLYERRIAAIKDQALVSEKSKQDISLLIFHLNELFTLDPFPAEGEIDIAPIDALKRDLTATEGDQEAIEQRLMDWVNQVRPGGAAAETAAPTPGKGGTTPINQRMIDGLTSFRSTVDKTRIRLMRDRDRYDREAYTAARNAFTLARSVYAERLQLNQVDATNEDCAQLEQVLTPAVAQATGDTFPPAIQAGADFVSARIFA